MKAIKGLITAVLLSAPLFANAYWEQTIDFTPDPLISAGLFGNSHTFKHDLTTAGFDPLQDVIDEYSVTINIYDDNAGRYETYQEKVLLSDGWFNHAAGTFEYNWVAGSVSLGEGFEGLFSLNLLGELWVTVSSLNGDFYLDSSTLTAWNSTSVPEPSSLALLAAGLFGIAAMRRSAARNNG